jgi:antitoxin YefM
MYMTTLSVAAARGSFSKLVEAAETNHERFEVTRNGRRVAVLLGADDYDGLLETLAVVSDSEAVEAIRAGLADLESGETFTAAEVRAAMVEAGCLQA